jgi:hypothetical protein
VKPGRIGQSINPLPGLAFLLPDTETLDDVPVTLDIFLFQIIKQSSPLANKLQQTPAGMMVFHMGLEMLGQIDDPCTEKGNLNLRRPCITIMKLVLANNFFSLFRI